MKKNSLKLLLFLSISLVVFNSCDNDNLNLKNETIISAGQYEFDLNINVNTSGSIEIPIYINNISSSDRTFNLTVSEESTGTSADYTVPSSVTIPANENEAMLTIASEAVTNTLILEIEEMPGVFAAEDIVINILKLCPFNIDNFVGTYDALEDGLYEYEVTVTKGADNTLILQNLYDYGGSATLIVDSSDPELPTISFAAAGLGSVLYVHPSYGDLYAVNPSTYTADYDEDDDTSSLELCESSISVAFVRQVSVGIFSTIINVVMTKK